MSLINSMLLDLDARHEQHYGFDNSIINSELKPVVTRRRHRYLKIIGLGMAIVSAAAFGLAQFIPTSLHLFVDSEGRSLYFSRLP